MKDSGNWICNHGCEAGYYAKAKEIVIGRAVFDNNGDWESFEPYDAIDSHELHSVSDHRVCMNCDSDMVLYNDAHKMDEVW